MALQIFIEKIHRLMPCLTPNIQVIRPNALYSDLIKKFDKYENDDHRRVHQASWTDNPIPSWQDCTP